MRTTRLPAFVRFRGAALTGSASLQSNPNPQQTAWAYLIADILSADPWAAHNRDLWGGGPDGTYRWRDQGDGFFSE